MRKWAQGPPPPPFPPPNDDAVAELPKPKWSKPNRTAPQEHRRPLPTFPYRAKSPKNMTFLAFLIRSIQMNLIFIIFEQKNFMTITFENIYWAENIFSKTFYIVKTLAILDTIIWYL